MLLLALCFALITNGSKVNTTIVSSKDTHLHNSSLADEVVNTLEVCTAIIQEVKDFRDESMTPNDARRRSEKKGLDDEALVEGVKEKLATCVDIVDVVNTFNKEYMEIIKSEDALREGPFKDPIILNVGGKRFTTSLSTLRSITGTFFEKMFRKGANTTISADGTYFIDRDPRTFGHILDYLRNGDMLIKSDDKNLRMELLDDAEYFELPKALKDYLQWSSVEGIDLWFSEVDFINKQLKKVSKELGGLLFQVSKDGDAVSTFHSRCDNKGPTVVIVETKEGNMFGGYSYTSWSSSGGYSHSSKAFLFRLRPTIKRYEPRSGSEQYAIYRHSSYGPTFGSHALNLKNCRYVATCYVGTSGYDIQYSYELNDGQQYFRIQDYAVVQAKAI